MISIGTYVAAVETIEIVYLFEQFKSKKKLKNTALKEVSFYIGQAQRDLANQAIQQANSYCKWSKNSKRYLVICQPTCAILII